MMMGFSNLHVRIPTSPIDSVAIVVLDCVVVVVEVERVVDSTSRRPWAIPVDFAVVVVVVASSPLSSSSSSLRTCSPWTCCYYNCYYYRRIGYF